MPDKAAALSSNPLFQLTAESKGSSIVEEESGGLKQLEGASTGREREGRQMRGGTCFVQNVIYGGFYARQKKDIIGSLSDYECRNTALGFGQHRVPTLETVEHIA